MTKKKKPPAARKPIVDASDFAKPEGLSGAPATDPATVPATDEDGEEEEEEASPEEGQEDASGEDASGEDAPAAESAAPGAEREAREHGPLISSRKNARIHLVKALGERRGRKREGKFLVEGVKVIKELLARKVPIELVLWKDGLEQRADAGELIADLRRRRIDAFGVVPALFDELTDTESSQGLIAVAPMQWRSLDDVLGPPVADAESAPPRAVLVAAGVQDPGNLGTILRSARFLGFAGVLCLSGTTDPWSPKVVRSSAGALIDAPPARIETLADLAAKARAHGYKTVALWPRGGSPLEKTTLPRRSLLLLGAEGPGLNATAMEAADVQVSLPASDPAAESLNAAMAFGIFAYAWRTAWASPPLG